MYLDSRMFRYLYWKPRNWFCATRLTLHWKLNIWHIPYIPDFWYILTTAFLICLNKYLQAGSQSRPEPLPGKRLRAVWNQWVTERDSGLSHALLHTPACQVLNNASPLTGIPHLENREADSFAYAHTYRERCTVPGILYVGALWVWNWKKRCTPPQCKQLSSHHLRVSGDRQQHADRPKRMER